MNETAYSGYYCRTDQADQSVPPELSTPIHNMWELDTNNANNTNNVNPCNSSSLGYFDEDHSTFFLNELAIMKTPAPISSCTEDTHATPTVTAPAFSNIPFVQIHTTDLQPTNKNVRSSFRRRAAEIKSEPIKSELADSSKDRANGTPTPPVRNTNSASLEGSNDVPIQMDQSNVMPKTATPTAIPEVHKCMQCAYLSIIPSNLQAHMSNAHTFNSNVEDMPEVINCPGCTNSFYSFNSLEVHLREDHIMVCDEISTLLFALKQGRKSVSDVTSGDASKTKRRIFIKNVDCMRDLSQTTMEQQNTHLSENFFQLNNETTNSDVLDLIDEALSSTEPVNKASEQVKQTISIKSVDVLREPALLRHEYQLPFSNVRNNDLMLNTNDAISNNGFSCGKTQLSGINSQPVNDEQTRRPKIYIKNVDILKEPMLLPTNLNATNTTNLNCNYSTTNGVHNGSISGCYQTGPELLNSTAVAVSNYDSNMNSLTSLTNTSEEPFLYDTINNNLNVVSNATKSNQINSTTYLNSYAHTKNSNENNFILNNARFVGDSNYDIVEYGAESPVFIEPTPPSQPVPAITSVSGVVNSANSGMTTEKQKIFIKNVDILKSPQFQQDQHQQHQRGTLHLRTVDELNLMNRNEVENLIAPNLEAHSNLATTNITTGDSAVDTSNVPLQQTTDDFGAHFPNGWPSEEYDLTDDLNCIITESIEPLMSLAKPNSCVEPTMRVRDVNQLSAAPGDLTLSDTLDTWTQMAENLLQDDFPQMYVQPEQPLAIGNSSNSNNSSTKPDNIVSLESSISNVAALSICDIPPLVPVTSTTRHAADELAAANATQNLASIQVPPLVPCTPPALIQLNKLDKCKSNVKSASIPEKQARIYVSNNLLESFKEPTVPDSQSQLPIGGTSVRGRPYGAKCTGISKQRKQSGSNNADELMGSKCKVNGCAFRFKSPKTLEYHKRCHNSGEGNNSMICPECKSTDFSHWNSLHTHLWRSHKIDMELYSCHLCSFKTPIYSRLKNTHTKIHSEERNYKCEQCGKAFKNTKQLKNHRRWHRHQPATKGTGSSADDVPSLHRCEDCGAAFTHQKSLREHLCKNREEQVQCEVCQRQMSSKSALKLHLLTHEKSKRLKCADCSYEANDHNAFRRHRMTHLEKTMYTCPYCDYKSIQSVAYQKHIKQKHPEQANEIVHKCAQCSYSTINRHLFNVHQAKHETTATLAKEQETLTPAADASLPASTQAKTQQPQQSKIKVKNNLLLPQSDISEDLLNSFNLLTALGDRL